MIAPQVATTVTATTAATAATATLRLTWHCRPRRCPQARELMKRNKLARDQAMLESGAGVKAVHDSIYRSKYVPADSADLLTSSKNAKFATA